MENSSTLSTPSVKPQRPVLLTVLCILSFIGGAWQLFGAISNYMNADVTSQMVTSVMDSARSEMKSETEGNSSAEKYAEKVISHTSALLKPDNIRKNSLYTILANLLTLGGAFLMFQLRKLGFWIYLAGTGIGILSPILVFGATNLMGIGMTAVYGFFGILFAVLYSLNLKHMK
jgi:hypothetical protein